MKTESKILGRLFNIHPNEYAPFGWTAALMFLILLSQIFFANYADTAFIKRFGVEYLPEMFMIDAVLVFFAMDLIRTLAERYSPTTLLTRLFVIFAAGGCPRHRSSSRSDATFIPKDPVISMSSRSPIGTSTRKSPSGAVGKLLFEVLNR